MKRYLYFTVFVTGMTTLAAELSASRLLGSVFGTSNLVWAAIIGLILIYLTLGYFLGGKWADSSPRFETMYGILTWGALSLGVVPYIARPILLAAANAFDGLEVGVMLGAFVAVLILFSIPITLLGMMSPFAIRLSIEDPAKAGKVSGNIYAISTLGSFLGTYLPVLLFIPTMGTRKTFLLFSVILLLVALLGLWVSGARKSAIRSLAMPILLLLFAFGMRGSIKNTPGQIYETESAYNYIQVLRTEGNRVVLRLNDGQGIHSVYDPATLDYNGPWEQFLAAPYFNAPDALEPVRRIAIVGLAAGTTARQATAVYGDIPIDGYEIDPKIVEVGRTYFGMTMPNLHVHIEDGRWGLAHSPYRYDIIAIDAYRPPYIPWHLTTREFFQIAYDHLREEGVVAINVGHLPDDRRLVDNMATTLAAVFPSIHIVDIPASLNTIIYATKQPTRAENLAANIGVLASRENVHPLLMDVLVTAQANLQPGYEEAQVFTDDCATIEWVTNDMIFHFIFGGELAQWQE